MTVDHFMHLQAASADKREAYAQYNYWSLKLSESQRKERVAKLRNEGLLSKKDELLLRYLGGGHGDALTEWKELKDTTSKPKVAGKPGCYGTHEVNEEDIPPCRVCNLRKECSDVTDAGFADADKATELPDCYGTEESRKWCSMCAVREDCINKMRGT